MNRIKQLMVVIACCSPLAVAAHPGHSAPTAAVTPLISKAFANIPGKEGLMVVVDYAPGAVDPVHRHDAHVFVYVLEGEIIMQVKGGKEVRLKLGETFYEDPDDIHVVGKNASDTEPAKFLVFFVKDEGAPPLTPVE